MAPRTFSQTTSPGRMVAIASRICTHKLERVPSVMPARLPACDRSWQGLPPAMMSTCPRRAAQSILVTSPRLGAFGNRWASTLRGPGSMSAT